MKDKGEKPKNSGFLSFSGKDDEKEEGKGFLMEKMEKKSMIAEAGKNEAPVTPAELVEKKGTE